MKFAAPLLRASLLRRYRRFLADVILEQGENATVACPNTGARHLRELAGQALAGSRAVMVYLVQSGHARRFGLAADLDPHYVNSFATARKAGVEAYAYCCKLTPEGITLDRAVALEEP